MATNATTRRPYPAIALLTTILVATTIIAILMLSAPAHAQATDPPAAPTGLTATSVTHDTVTLAWHDPNDDAITHYQVLRRNPANQDPGVFTTIASNTDSSTASYTDSSVAEETKYVYRVIAVNPAGDSRRSNYVNVTTPAAPQESQDPPAKPTGLSTTTVEHNSVSLAWDNPSDDTITHYKVLRRNADTDDPGVFTTISENTGSASPAYTDDTATAETNYVYRVVAVNPHGNSLQSSYVNATTPAEPTPEPPSAPTGLSATTIQHDQVILAWDEAQDDSITHHKVLRRKTATADPDVFTTISDNTGSPNPSYTDTTVSAETQYEYRIVAVNPTGNSPQSASLTVTTTANPEDTEPPPAPKTLAVTAPDANTIELRWSTPADDSIDGYQILRRLRDGRNYGDGNGRPGFQVLVDDTGSTDTSYTDTDVTPRTRYAYRVKSRSEDMLSNDSPTARIETPQSNITALSSHTLLSGITVDGGAVPGFSSSRNSYEYGIVSTTTQVTVAATAGDGSSTVEILPADADTATGHQVRLSAGQNAVTITVTATDSTTGTYTINLNRGVDTDYGWKAVDDFDTLIAAGNIDPFGVTANATTMWVADTVDDKLYAYRLSDGTRDTSKDFTLHSTNATPSGTWSTDTTMWVVDAGLDKVFAYRMSDQMRDSAKDITLHLDNEKPRGIWTNDTTMWVADELRNRIFAYNLSSKARDHDREFNTLEAAGNGDPTGIWSDNQTMWVADWHDVRIYAYRMSDKVRDTSKDFTTLDGAGNNKPLGIWSDGTTVWVGDTDDQKLYSYNMPPSDDTNLRSLTVSPKNIIGFDPDRYAYQLGVSNDVTRATMVAVANHPAATFEFASTDADTTADGHQVDLTAGRNSVAITVNAADGIATEIYTISINQGVNEEYGWKAGHDFDGLISAGIISPRGIWANDTTMWVTDHALTDHRIRAFRLSDGIPDPEKDFDNLSNEHVQLAGIWSDDTTMWVVDSLVGKLFAYRTSDQARDPDKDFNTLNAAGNTSPVDLWSDRTTMWVSDHTDRRIYAYRMSDKARDPSKEFNDIPGSIDTPPQGIWSDGATMWVTHIQAGQIRAFSMSDQERQPDQDFITPHAAGSTNPQSIFSDGTTMWTADNVGDKVYAYNLPISEDATLRTLTVSPKDIIGFDPDSSSYEVGVASTVSRATVSVLTNHPAATVEFTPTDADTTAAGHQVDLTAGQNAVTITVTAADDSTETYTVNVNQGVTDAFGWNAEHDLDGLVAAGNISPTGLWSDNTTVWIADYDHDKLFAYNLEDGSRESTKDFNTLKAAGNDRPRGGWSDGETIWIADWFDKKIYAYRRSDMTRDISKEFTTLVAAGNSSPAAIWSNGTTMWVTDDTDKQIYAYKMSDKTHDATKDFTTLEAAGHDVPVGIWSDDTTMWVVEQQSRKVLAYSMNTKARQPAKDFTTLTAAGSYAPNDIWSNGSIMWVSDSRDNKVYAYNIPPSGDAALSDITVSPKNIIGFDQDRTSYELGVASDVTRVTFTTTTNHPDASFEFASTDADTTTEGHQVDLAAGQNAVTITVTAQDGVATQTYTININRGTDEAFGWKASADIDTLIAAGNTGSFGTWSDGVTIWVSNIKGDSRSSLLAYNLSDGTRDPAQDFELHDNNISPYGIWSDKTTLWVSDIAGNRIYAYRMSDKSRDSEQDFFNLSAAGHDNPQGIWSNGSTMWAVDGIDANIYAYNMSDKTRDSSKDFDGLTTAGNTYPAGIWSDGTTMWVADNIEAKIFAYSLSDKTHATERDFKTLRGADNTRPAGIWSNSTTMWVVGQDNDKIYSYNMPFPPLTGLTASDGEDRRVTLRWNNPDRNEITGHQYRVSDDDGSTWNPDWTNVPGSNRRTTSHTVRNLTNDVTYTFEVKATTTGIQQAPSRVTATPLAPPTVPEPPLNLFIKSRDASLLATWDPPPEQDERVPVTSYRVRYRINGSSSLWTNVSRSSSDSTPEQLIANLVNETIYEVQVASVNRIGASAWSTSVTGKAGAPTCSEPESLCLDQWFEYWFGPQQLAPDSPNTDFDAVGFNENDELIIDRTYNPPSAHAPFVVGDEYTLTLVRVQPRFRLAPRGGHYSKWIDGTGFNDLQAETPEGSLRFWINVERHQLRGRVATELVVTIKVTYTGTEDFYSTTRRVNPQGERWISYQDNRCTYLRDSTQEAAELPDNLKISALRSTSSGGVIEENIITKDGVPNSIRCAYSNDWATAGTVYQYQQCVGDKCYGPVFAGDTYDPSDTNARLEKTHGLYADDLDWSTIIRRVRDDDHPNPDEVGYFVARENGMSSFTKALWDARPQVRNSYWSDDYVLLTICDGFDCDDPIAVRERDISEHVTR